MYCEICCSEGHRIIIVLPTKQGDGGLNTMACLSCAAKSPAFCQKHGKPHWGFDGGTTACIQCIEEMVLIENPKLPVFLTRLSNELPKDEYGRLLQWAALVEIIYGDFFGPKQVCILRALATKALRSQINIEEVVSTVIKEKSVDSIIPKTF